MKGPKRPIFVQSNSFSDFSSLKLGLNLSKKHFRQIEAGAAFAAPVLNVWKLAELGEVLDGADHLGGVGVLVVVPGNDLDLRVAVLHVDDHGLGGIEQGAEAHADDIGGNDLVGVVAEGLGGFRLHLGVDLFLGGVAFHDGVQDGGGAGGGVFI